ncbi:MAG: Hsp33 family molecular chaperone HslO [Polyangiaceae bacterium]
MTLLPDSALRAMTDDSTFRVIAVRTTETVREVLERQKAEGATASAFADLLTGAILIRETMAPTQRVQAILRRQGKGGSLVADSHPSGGTRGLINLPKDEQGFSFGSDTALQVMRRLYDGSIHQGVTSVPEGGNVSEALMTYMRSSEQVDSMVAVGSVFEQGNLVAAGGYLVQLLPGVGTAPLVFMNARIEEFGSLAPHLAASGFAPRGLLASLLEQIPYTELEESSLRFECWCSAERLLGALATLPKSDIDEFIERGEVLEISCDYCHREYQIPPAKLRGLQLTS